MRIFRFLKVKEYLYKNFFLVLCTENQSFEHEIQCSPLVFYQIKARKALLNAYIRQELAK